MKADLPEVFLLQGTTIPSETHFPPCFQKCHALVGPQTYLNPIYKRIAQGGDFENLIQPHL